MDCGRAQVLVTTPNIGFIVTRQYYVGQLQKPAAPPSSPHAQMGQAGQGEGAGAGSPSFDPDQHKAMLDQIRADLAQAPKNVEKRVMIGNIYFDGELPMVRSRDRLAKVKAGLGVTVHAGEEGNIPELRYVVRTIQPNRIGLDREVAEPDRLRPELLWGAEQAALREGRELARGGRRKPGALVYISTSGVYGDCGGDWVAETRPVAPVNGRAVRRVDAERQLRAWGETQRVQVTILRAPGIYAADRLPLERVRRGTPALIARDDSYTNHIHADDLARLAWAALFRGRSQRIYHAVDAHPLKMGDWFDSCADAFGLPRPPRVNRAEAEKVLSEALLSFLRESRQLSNVRTTRELRLKYRYPASDDLLREIKQAGPDAREAGQIPLF